MSAGFTLYVPPTEEEDALARFCQLAINKLPHDVMWNEKYGTSKLNNHFFQYFIYWDILCSYLHLGAEQGQPLEFMGGQYATSFITNRAEFDKHKAFVLAHKDDVEAEINRCLDEGSFG